eukprot:342273-Chlamydomonas_euryale.AAC.3
MAQSLIDAAARGIIAARTPLIDSLHRTPSKLDPSLAAHLEGRQLVKHELVEVTLEPQQALLAPVAHIILCARFGVHNQVVDRQPCLDLPDAQLETVGCVDSQPAHATDDLKALGSALAPPHPRRTVKQWQQRHQGVVGRHQARQQPHGCRAHRRREVSQHREAAHRRRKSQLR